MKTLFLISFGERELKWYGPHNLHPYPAVPLQYIIDREIYNIASHVWKFIAFACMHATKLSYWVLCEHYGDCSLLFADKGSHFEWVKRNLNTKVR